MSFGNLTTFFSDQERAYTGPELRPHFLLTEFQMRGNALGAFIGPSHVKTEHLVDWQDRMENEKIEARSMIHFLGEFFGISLARGVLLQRLFIATLAESLNARLSKSSRELVRRSGNDIYLGERKFSVSIVTSSPVSILLHVGVNVDPTGAPIPAVGLAELGIEPKQWAQSMLEEFRTEYASLDWACAKVRPVM